MFTAEQYDRTALLNVLDKRLELIGSPLRGIERADDDTLVKVQQLLACGEPGLKHLVAFLPRALHQESLVTDAQQ